MFLPEIFIAVAIVFIYFVIKKRRQIITTLKETVKTKGFIKDFIITFIIFFLFSVYGFWNIYSWIFLTVTSSIIVFIGNRLLNPKNKNSMVFAIIPISFLLYSCSFILFGVLSVVGLGPGMAMLFIFGNFFFLMFSTVYSVILYSRKKQLNKQWPR